MHKVKYFNTFENSFCPFSNVRKYKEMLISSSKIISQSVLKRYSSGRKITLTHLKDETQNCPRCQLLHLRASEYCYVYTTWSIRTKCPRKKFSLLWISSAPIKRPRNGQNSIFCRIIEHISRTIPRSPNLDEKFTYTSNLTR